MKPINPEQAFALQRRRQKMISQINYLSDILRASANTGEPFLATPQWRAALLHFEADRVRVEAACKGDPTTNDAEVAALVAGDGMTFNIARDE
jgi:hypothetical protein